MRILLSLVLLAGCPGPVSSDSGDTSPDDTGVVDTDTNDTVDTGPCEDCEACEDAGYQSVIAGKSGPELKTALSGAMDGLWCEDYGTATRWMFLELDNEGGEVECVYTGRRTVAVNEKPDANTDMNTEHTWPRSEGAQENPAKCDVNNLFPSDSEANGKRGNLPFGKVVAGIDWEEGGSKIGLDDDGETVFEPRDVHKGNVARAMFYFQLQYPQNTSGNRLSASEVALFQQWHDADPADDTEIARAIAIGDEQGVANPFVVCPDLVDEVPH